MAKLESFHYFLKACIAKHVSTTLEWDDIVPLVCTAYNFFPNKHSRECSFFLIFGQDVLVPLVKLLQPKVRYLGNDENILSMEALQNIYQLVTTNLKYARERKQPKTKVPNKLKEGDLVLVRNHTTKSFEPWYVGDYRMVRLKGNQVEVKPVQGGSIHLVHVSDVKYILPIDNVVSKIPDYKLFGQLATL